MKRLDRFPSAVLPRGFTLIELLVVIAIIAVLGGLTALGYRGVANDAKLSSAKNTVMASLDTARGLAIKNNRPTVVAFRARLLSRGDSRVEVVIGEWRRNSLLQSIDQGFGAADRNFDVFTPVAGVEPRVLAKGISIAGPTYFDNTLTDSEWMTPSNVANLSEGFGHIIAVMYGPDGRTYTANPMTTSNQASFGFLDLNGDGEQDRPLDNGSILIASYALQQGDEDESILEFVPFLCVFDEKEARDVQGDSDWNIQSTRENELSVYISQNADRIHFNRYSGVAMK